MGKKDWFYTLGLIILFFTVFIIGYFIVKNNPNMNGFSFKNLTELLGIIISSVSIVITSFFVVLAIDAYGNIRKIKSEAKEVNSMRNLAIQSCHRIGETTLTNYDCAINSIEVTLSFLNRRYLDEKDKKTIELYKKWREDYKRERSRLGLHPYLFQDDRRQALLLNLGTLGNIDDIKILENLYNSDTESRIIKDTAKIVLDELNKKNGDMIRDY